VLALPVATAIAVVRHFGCFVSSHFAFRAPAILADKIIITSLETWAAHLVVVSVLAKFVATVVADDVHLLFGELMTLLGLVLAILVDYVCR